MNGNEHYRIIDNGYGVRRDSHSCFLPSTKSFKQYAIIQCRECRQLWGWEKGWIGGPYWKAIRESRKHPNFLVIWRGYDGLPPERWHFWKQRKV